MRFANSEEQLTQKDIVEAELILGFKFPPAVRNLYAATNGGIPEPYVFENADVDTVVTEFLPLKSEHRRTALKSYERLVHDAKLVPPNFFPFAVEGGGDYFLVDCSTSNGAVYFLKADLGIGEPLVNLKVNFEIFWSLLKEE